MATLIVWKHDDPMRNALAGQLIDVVPDGKDWSDSPMMRRCWQRWLLLDVPDDTDIPLLRQIDYAAGYRKPRVLHVVDLSGVDTSGVTARVETVNILDVDLTVR